MDIDKLKHHTAKHPLTFTVAVVLSVMVVTMGAFLGHGFLQLKGALSAEVPNELTVVTLLEQENPDTNVTNVSPIPQRDESTTYNFTYTLENGDIYLARIGKQVDGNQWELKHTELLHRNDATGAL